MYIDINIPPHIILINKMFCHLYQKYDLIPKERDEIFGMQTDSDHDYLSDEMKENSEYNNNNNDSGDR